MPVNVQQCIELFTKKLKAAGIVTAHLESLIIIEDILGVNRATLLAHPEMEISISELDRAHILLDKRSRHIPLAYLRGISEFFGRQFIITPAVLVPRPETEVIIEQLRSVINHSAKQRIVDIGTGSGALGISAALEFPSTEVTLVDIDEAALDVARKNCVKFQKELPCIIDDLLSHAAKRKAKFDIVIANLPYVPNDYQINKDASHEPKIAIFGGMDGLVLYRRLFSQCQELYPAFILTESLPFQHVELEKIAASCGYQKIQEHDLIQVFKLFPPS